MRSAKRAAGAGSTALAVVASVAVLGVPGAQAHDALPQVSIQTPIAATAGPVTLRGAVGPAAGDVTTVLYVVDATQSTSAPAGSDCSGNHVVGNEDDLNSDGGIGDVLDCEIAGVGALNQSLVGKPGVQAGLVAFANDAAAADLDPAGDATFLPPDYSGGDASPRIETVARSVVRTAIGLYEPTELGGSGDGTAFNNAVRTALDTLAEASQGPKWIMFLSDGQSPIDDALLAELTTSQVRLRSFAIGPDASCASHASLAKMARATGEACVSTRNPANLAAGLTGSEPDAVSNVTVSVRDVSVAADLDAVGGWSATFNLGAGTYTGTVDAVFSTGRVASAQTQFTVSSALGGPAPGTVTPGAGVLKATVVKVHRPRSTRKALPPRVSGRVGVPLRGFTVTRQLAQARVLLQARRANGATWTTVDRDRVDWRGRFDLIWAPKARFTQLRVQLTAGTTYAASSAVVPAPRISACRVSKRSGGWTVRCLTTARNRRVVHLLRDGQVIDTARVRLHTFRLDGTGAVRGNVIDVSTSSRHHARLVL